jgi:MinD superfamily P-loop ATPase
LIGDRFVVVVSGGKGGTGKSMFATNLAITLGDFVLVDLDVETPNDHVLLGSPLMNRERVFVFHPLFDRNFCLRCGSCRDACNENAIVIDPDGYPFLIDDLCSGCTACMLVCKADGAIKRGNRLVGYTYCADTKYGFYLVTGEVIEGRKEVFKVVLDTKRRAFSILGGGFLIDTPAGTGNTVFKAIEGANLLIAVAEPTEPSALDLRKILDITAYLSIKTWLVINKVGIGDNRCIYDVADTYGVDVVAEIPYSTDVFKSYVSGVPISCTGVFESVFSEIAGRIRGIMDESDGC